MISSFQKLNLIQFLAALNENLYRMLIAFFLIYLLGAEDASEVMATTGFLFLIPFVLFSTLGGLLADKYSKKTIVVVTRFFEWVFLLLSAFVVAMNSLVGCYILILLLATTAAIFGPSKYGLIPEFYPKQKLVTANSIIAGFTFFGIILGTGLASLTVEISYYSVALLIASFIALIALLISTTLPQTKRAAPDKQIPVLFYRELFISLVEMKRLPKLLPATFAYAYFLFIGAFVQFNIVPFSINELRLPIISGGYLFLLAAVGIAIGAFVTAKISLGKNNLMLIPYSGFAISVAMICLALFPSMFWLIALGFFGGIFLVPSQTHILDVSPEATRGRNFSTANFLSFLFALLASLAIYVLNTLLGLEPETSFIVVGVLNTLVMFYFLIAL